MAKDIYELRVKLLSGIRQANSGAEVIRLLDATIGTLIENKINGYIIIRFIEKVYADIEHLKADSSEQEELLKLFHTALTRLRSLKIRLMSAAVTRTQ